MNTNDIIQVLIAEDEPLILDNIAKKTEKASPCIHVAGKAQSGQEALDLLKRDAFDILITDIEMPGMSGLELIRQVRELYPSLRVVILSGYSNFEYARTALRYGIEDYLLKPLDQETLTELLTTLCLQIREEKKALRREILSLALTSGSDDSAPPSLFAGDSLCLIYLSLGNPVSSHNTMPPTLNRTFKALWEKFQLEDCFRNAREVEHVWIIDEKSPMQKFLILHLSGKNSPAEYFRILISNYLERNLGGFPYTLLIYAAPVSYHQLWEKAEFLRNILMEYARCFTQMSAIVSEAELPASDADSDVLKDMDLLFSITDITRYLQHIHSTLPDTLNLPSSVLEHCAELIYDSMAKNFQIDPQECTCAKNAFLSTLPAMQSPELCMHNLDASLHELWESVAMPVTGSILCHKIAQYIELNLKKQFSLTDLADHFGYTPSYINRIFKKEYGLSPLQYLTSLKITRAKELLRSNTEINIRHVAEAVGYEDSRYFSRIFKNETGMTPSAWAEQEKSGFVGETLTE